MRQRADTQSELMVHALSGLYCAVAIFMLVFFGLEAIVDGDNSYGITLLGFSLATFAGYGVVWYSGHLQYSGHLVAVLMALLCLYLFYSGGADNTGMLWYFIYPSLVIFIQGVRTGLVSVVLLLTLTLVINWFELFDFDPARYSNATMQRFVAVYVTVTVLACLFAVSRNLVEKKLEQTNARLAVISITDPLTGLVNRRRMDDLLVAEAGRFARQKSPFCVVLIDIDHFKNLNDSYGHQFGDYVLQAVADICRQSLRGIDTVSRWGGEEFLVLLPGTTLAEARTAVERLRTDISAASFSFQGHSTCVTISLGLAQFRQGSTPDTCILRADRCLYQAKHTGRNRIVGEDQLPGEGGEK